MSYGLEFFYNIENVSVVSCDSVRVSGWCFSSDLQNSLKLEFVSFDSVLSETECDIRRDDVRDFYFPDKKNEKKFPLCGFSAIVPAAKDINKIDVIEKESGIKVTTIDIKDLDRSHQSHWIVEEDQEEINNLKTSREEAYTLSNTILPHIRKELVRAANDFLYKPLISILMPVYNVHPKYLKEAVESLNSQIYSNWELCIANDASTNKGTLELLDELEFHEKVKIVHRDVNGHICEASNDAASLASGEYVALMDNDDLLAPHALFEIVRLLQKCPDADLIYTDEDKINEKGEHFDLHFKPDWSPVLFLGYNYINHLNCTRRSLFENVGRFRLGYEGAQDYDLLLRITERTDKIYHIPKILYHWRAIPGSTAMGADEKPIVSSSAIKILEESLQRRTVDASIYSPDFAQRLRVPVYQLEWSDDGPSVEIIIPTYNQYELLKQCIDSILQKTTYKNYSIFVIDNGSDETETIDYLNVLKDTEIRIERILNESDGFSYSRVNNIAVSKSKADLVLLLNNDTEIIEPKWLSRMVGYLSLNGVGAVGARLLYPNNTIQHAGVVLGMGGGFIPGHAFSRVSSDNPGYFFLANTAHEMSAVTAACLLLHKETFDKIKGLDEENFKVSMNDVDLCLKVQSIGMSVVYAPGSELIHHESVTRSKSDNPIELANFRDKYRDIRDKYYSINLSCKDSYAISNTCILDYEEFIENKINVLFFTHNLNFEGAPNILSEVAYYIHQNTNINPIIVSPVDGPARKILENKGLEVHLLKMNDVENILSCWRDREELELAINIMVDFIHEHRCDLVVANVLNSYWVIEASIRSKVPNIFWIHESYNKRMIKANIGEVGLSVCERALKNATKLLYVSNDTAKLYQRYDNGSNISVIHNSVVHQDEEKVLSADVKTSFKNKLGVDKNTKVILSLGTVGERKDQGTLIDAIKDLRLVDNNFICIIVGYRESLEYSREIKKNILDNHLEGCVWLIPETNEVEKYYLAADIFVLTSLNESYALTILEAMSYGLPIITTMCHGLSEQVRLGVNAESFGFMDSEALGQKLIELSNNEEKLNMYSNNSFQMIRYMQTKKEMMKKYERLIFSVYSKSF